MKALGYKPPAQNSLKHQFMLGKNKVFNPDVPADYIKSFTIRRA